MAGLLLMACSLGLCMLLLLYSNLNSIYLDSELLIAILQLYEVCNVHAFMQFSVLRLNHYVNANTTVYLAAAVYTTY